MADHKTAKLNPTAYMILGMLQLGQETGYEIKRLADRSTRFFWGASHAQIYPQLGELRDAGLIDGREEPTGKRRRVVYRLLPEGERVLSEWLSADEPLSFELRDLGLLKLFFADALATDQVAAVTARLRARHEQALAELREQEAAAHALAEAGQMFPELTLRFGIDYHQMAIRWSTQIERELDARKQQ